MSLIRAPIPKMNPMFFNGLILRFMNRNTSDKFALEPETWRAFVRDHPLAHRLRIPVERMLALACTLATSALNLPGVRTGGQGSARDLLTPLLQELGIQVVRVPPGNISPEAPVPAFLSSWDETERVIRLFSGAVAVLSVRCPAVTADLVEDVLLAHETFHALFDDYMPVDGDWRHLNEGERIIIEEIAARLFAMKVCRLDSPLMLDDLYRNGGTAPGRCGTQKD